MNTFEKLLLAPAAAGLLLWGSACESETSEPEADMPADQTPPPAEEPQPTGQPTIYALNGAEGAGMVDILAPTLGDLNVVNDLDFRELRLVDTSNNPPLPVGVELPVPVVIQSVDDNGDAIADAPPAEATLTMEALKAYLVVVYEDADGVKMYQKELTEADDFFVHAAKGLADVTVDVGTPGESCADELDGAIFEGVAIGAGVAGMVPAYPGGEEDADLVIADDEGGIAKVTVPAMSALDADTQYYMVAFGDQEPRLAVMSFDETDGMVMVSLDEDDAAGWLVDTECQGSQVIDIAPIFQF